MFVLVVDADLESGERRLVQLVVTLVELLRQLMERRRYDASMPGDSPRTRSSGWAGR